MFKKTLILFILATCLLLAGYKAAGQSNDSIYAAYNNKWLAFAGAGKFDSALYCIKKVQSIADADPKLSRTSAYLHAATAITYQAMNDFNMACREVKISASMFEAQVGKGDTTVHTMNLYSRALSLFVEINQQAGDFTNAMFYLQQYMRQRTVPRGSLGYLNGQKQLAFHYLHFGDYAKAMSEYDSVLHYINSEKKDSVTLGYPELYTNCAIIYTETGNPEKALVCLKKAVAYCCTERQLTSGDFLATHDQAPVLLDLAEAYRALHYNDSALQVLALLQNRFGSNPLFGEYCADILYQKAAICMDEYKDEYKYAHALPLYRQTLQILDTLQTRSDYYSPAILSLGALYTQTKKYAAADSVFRKEINYLYGQGLSATYNLQQALEGLCKNLLYQSKNVEAADSLVAAGNLALRVLTKNFAGMPEGDKLRYTAAFDVFFDMLYTLLAKGGALTSTIKKLAFQLQLQRKNMVLASQAILLSRLRQTTDTVVAGIYAGWLTAREMLAKQYSLPYSDRFLNTDSLEQVSEELEKRASFLGYKDGFNNNSGILSTFLLRGTNAANIEFVRYNQVTKKGSGAAYAAFLLRSGDSIPVFVPLCGEAALTTLMQDDNRHVLGNEQLVQKFYTTGTQTSAALYKLIWQPLKKYIAGDTIINYSPAGLLDNIAFTAVTDGKNFVGGVYSLHRFSSLAGIGMGQTWAPPGEMSLWGNMDYDNGDTATISEKTRTTEISGQSLTAQAIKPAIQAKSISKAPLAPFYTDELAPIKKVFDSTHVRYNSYEKATATEENFKAAAPAIKGVLHISTHAFYTPYDKNEAGGKLPAGFIAGNANPLFRCGLAFAGVNYYWMKGMPRQNHDDGILTGYEVSQLDLHNVRLVTLSACETGLGDITATEGNLGLQRAFKMAGVKNLLVSLWQVPAKQTANLLAKFYTYWLNGKTPAEALGAAQKVLRDEGRTPYEWAGFVLVE